MFAAPTPLKKLLVSATYDCAREGLIAVAALDALTPFRHQSMPIRNGVRQESYW